MMRRIAVVGDQLDTGGQIERYAGPRFEWGDGGHQVALIGGAAYCEACNSIGAIAKSGGPRRISLFTGEIALHGDIVLCNCASPARIVAHLAGEAWCDDTDHTVVASPSNTAHRGTEPENTTYDEQFTLSDDIGRPCANVRYRIVTDGGQVFHGTTNASGRTQRVITQGSSRLQLQLEK